MTTQTPRPLTARQREVLEFIRDNSAYYSPSVREIAAGVRIKSPNGVMNHIVALEKKGAIRRKPGQHRNIEVVA
jgi:repressor LexA